VYGIPAQGRKAGKVAAGENDNSGERSNRDAIRRVVGGFEEPNKALLNNEIQLAH
jgi:hypothetical protein